MAAKVRRNDTVLITKGRERGKRGKVSHVFPDEGRVTIEGVNIVKRHTRSRGPNTPGGVIEKEAPLRVANLALVCPRCDHPARVGFRFLDDGAKVRTCKRCGELID